MPIKLHPICLGIDIAKAKLDVCLLSDQHSHCSTFENSAAGLKKLISWLRKLNGEMVPVVMEATGPYGDLAAEALHKAGCFVSVVNPRRIKDHARSDGRRNKTDRLDAELIASYGRTHELDRWLPPSQEVAELRALLRRMASIEVLIQAETRRSEVASDHASLRASLDRIRRVLKAELKTLQKTIRSHISAHPVLAADCARLQAIEGIGIKTSRVLVAELPLHLESSRAAAAWVGVTPRPQRSGSSLHTTARVGPEGNRHLRRALYMPAVVARSKNPRFKIFADRLQAAGKAKMSVIIAVLHKLVRTAFAILKKQSTYSINHYPLNPSPNH